MVRAACLTSRRSRHTSPRRFALCLLLLGEFADVVVLAHITISWHDSQIDATLVLGKQGRLVIPVEVRTALGLSPGDRLHLHVTGPRLVLERQRDAVAELRALARDVPRSRSFVEELLAERRLAAASE